MTTKIASASLVLWSLLLACACTGPPDPPAPPPDDPPPEVVDDTETPAVDEPIDTMSFDGFWPAFQAGIVSIDGELVGDLVVFPLKDAQYLIGQPNNSSGINRQDFIDNFRLVFDGAARAKIAELADSELEPFALDVDRYGIEGLEADGRRFRVNYQEDDYESTVIYVFGKTPDGYRLIEINLAG